MARLISCSVCYKVHLNTFMCEKKIARQKEWENKYRNRKEKAKRVDNAVYNSRRWRKLRALVLEDHNYICLYTLFKEGRIIKADCVHHITEIIDNEALAYEYNNLICLSKEKHKLIHELYKEDKEKVQEELREMNRRWQVGERE